MYMHCFENICNFLQMPMLPKMQITVVITLHDGISNRGGNVDGLSSSKFSTNLWIVSPGRR